MSFVSAFGISTLAICLAEMGDKSQLLAMAFAARFRWQTVLWAILAATLLNHLLAVIAGNAITSFIPIAWVKLLAAVSFLAFSLWTIRNDAAPDAATYSCANPLPAICAAFFLAEMGDKTQVMTMTLAADQAALRAACGFWERAARIMPVWIGTTAGMMIADSMGIVVGLYFNKRIPINAIKWIAATAFALFGILGLRENLNCVLPINKHIPWIALAALQAVLMFVVARTNSRQS